MRRSVLLLSLLLACGLPRALAKTSVQAFRSGGREVHYEVFPSGKVDDPLLIVLPGTSGPQAPLYRSQAAYFAGQGYTTLLLNFFDAGDSHTPATSTYRLWASALADLVRACGERPEFKGRAVFVLGFSLGASVALAAGSEKLAVAGIAEWYGSLPDQFFFALKGMPPLLILHGARDNNIPVINAQQLTRLCGMEHFDCTTHIYPEENHGFSKQALPDADARTLDFFRQHLGTAAPNP